MAQPLVKIHHRIIAIKCSCHLIIFCAFHDYASLQQAIENLCMVYSVLFTSYFYILVVFVFALLHSCIACHKLFGINLKEKEKIQIAQMLSFAIFFLLNFVLIFLMISANISLAPMIEKSIKHVDP